MNLRGYGLPLLLLAAITGSFFISPGRFSISHHLHAQPASRNLPDDAPVPGDQVVIHQLSDAESLNLITANDATSQEVHALMYETLTIIDPYSLKTIPWIAESLPKVSKDRLSYEYRIRKDAKFSDGKPVTGRDFIFYLKAIKNPEIVWAAPLRGYYSRIDRLELVGKDPYHLRVVMNRPYHLAEDLLGSLYAFPKHIWDPDGISDGITFRELNEQERTPATRQMARIIDDREKGFDRDYLVASGPYMFEAFRRNDRLALVRNPNYWNRRHEYGAAYPDRIVFRTIMDDSAAMAALKAGEIDFLPVIPKDRYHAERPGFAEHHLKEAVYDYPAYIYIGYNQKNPLFKDPKVRRGLAHMVDREEIIRTVYHGFARTVESPVFRGRPEYDTTLAPIPFDPQKARELLAEAGWSDSDGNGILDMMIDGELREFRFNILLNAGNQRRREIALRMVDELEKIGIVATIVNQEWAMFLERLRTGKYDAYIGGWATSPVEGDMYQMWHSTSAKEGGTNYIRYRNPELDKVIEAIHEEFDFAKRVELYRQAQRIIHKDQPYTFLVSEQQTGAYHNRFRNVRFFAPRPGYNPAWWWVPAGSRK